MYVYMCGMYFKVLLLNQIMYDNMWVLYFVFYYNIKLPFNFYASYNPWPPVAINVTISIISLHTTCNWIIIETTWTCVAKAVSYDKNGFLLDPVWLCMNSYSMVYLNASDKFGQIDIQLHRVMHHVQIYSGVHKL